MKSLPKLSAFLLITSILMLTTATPTNAWSFSISRNGSDSYNRIQAKLDRYKSLTQLNTTSIVNSIDISTDTGDNKVDDTTGGDSSINSGSVYSYVSITNEGSTNTLIDNCCHDGDNHDDPCPSPTPTPTPTPTPSPTPTPTPTPNCTTQKVWADVVYDSDQGNLKSGAPITDPDRISPSAATGEPDGKFFSLGDGGTLTVRFLQPVTHFTKGMDLSFHEETWERPDYPEETASVEVSDNGSDWYPVGSVANHDGGDGVSYLDFTPTGLEEISYVRLTDTTDYSLHNDAADGYDIDAIDAHVLVCE